MLLPMKELGLVDQLAMFAATGAGLLVIVIVAGGLNLLVRYLFKNGHLWGVKKP